MMSYLTPPGIKTTFQKAVHTAKQIKNFKM